MKDAPFSDSLRSYLARLARCDREIGPWRPFLAAHRTELQAALGRTKYLKLKSRTRTP